jgi:hypothetical protein
MGIREGEVGMEVYVARPAGGQPTRSRMPKSPCKSGGMPEPVAEEMGSTRDSRLESGMNVSGVGELTASEL